MKTWVKFYTKTLRDPDMASLSWAQRGIWGALLALAGMLDDRDEHGRQTGRLDTFGSVAWHLRCDDDELTKALKALEIRGKIDTRDGVLFIHNEPYDPPSSRPQSAIAAWRAAVFARDDYTCQACGTRGIKLQAHHIIPWYLNSRKRFDLSNGITL